MALHSIKKIVENTKHKLEKFLGFIALKKLGLLSAYIIQT